MTPRRDLLIGVAVALVVAAAAVLWMLPARTPKPTASEPARVAVQPEPARPPVNVPTVVRSPRHYTLGSESEAQPGSLTAQQALAAAERLRRSARFPPNSQKIEDNLDPISIGREPKRARSAPPNVDYPVLVAYPAVTEIEAPGTVLLYAEVVQRESLDNEELKRQERDPREERIGAQAIRGEIRNAAGQTVATVEFRDDGKGGDAEPNDRFFTVEYTPDPDKPNESRGAFRVIVTADTNDGDQLKATTGFTYSFPTAHLTGNYRDKIVEGSLQVEVEVEVDEPGTYRLEATLTSEQANMLGHAEETVTLQPGRAWIPLTFYGLILRDHNVDGPYGLWSVVLSNVRENGLERSDVVPAAHTTRAYKVTEFSDVPYGDPDKLERAEQLEQRAREENARAAAAADATARGDAR
jgi:hypothetical protein